MLTLRTLGRLELLDGEHRLRMPRAREAALLTYVAGSGERGVPREVLADTFWPNSTRAHALHSLSQALYRLTRDAPSLKLDADQIRIRVESDSLSVDLLGFRTAIRQKDYSAAADLYAGPFLPGLSGDDAPGVDQWLEQTRRELSALAREMFANLLAGAERRGDWNAAYSAARALVELDPCDQDAAASEIGLLIARGARAEASARFAAVVGSLDSVGCAPSRRLLDVGTALQAGHAGAESSPSGFPVAFVGRRREFARLASALGEAQAGHGNAVFLTGRAGVGKTRLCEQLLRLAIIRGFRTFTAACAPLEDALPYSTARQLLSGMGSSDRAPARQRLLAHLLPDSPAPRDEAATHEPPPREAVFDAVATLFRSIAESSPVLLLVEDAHWIDDSTWGLLQWSARALKDARVLLLLSARPEELVARAARGKELACDDAQALELSDFDTEEAEEFVNAFNKLARRPVAPEQLTILRRKAGGHPFFLLEMLRQFERGDADFGSTPRNEIPDSIGQFLAARFRMLSPGGLLAAEVLAVLGGSAKHETLQAVAGVSADELADAVEELMRNGHVRDGQDEVAFLHELFREAAYERLSFARRKPFHARAARVLRQMRGVDIGVLALHSELAGDAQAAYRYAIAAAARAEARYGHAEAEHYWRRAEHHAFDVAGRVRAQEGLAECLYRLSRPAEARALYEGLLRSQADERRKVLYRARLAAVDARVGDVTIVASELRELLGAVAGIRGVDARLTAYESLTLSLIASGDSDIVRDYTPTIAETAVAATDNWSKVIVLTNLAELAAFNGCWNEAERFCRLGMEAARRSNPYVAGLLHSALAVLFLMRGQVGRAENECKVASDLMSGPESIFRRPNTLANWGVLKTESGDFDGAIRCFHGALAICAGNEKGYFFRMALANLAIAEYEAGHLDAAVAHAEQVLSDVDGAAEALVVSATGLLGLIALERSDPHADTCLAAVMARIGRVNPLGMDISYAEIFLARMSERDGDVPGALERLERAIQFYANRDFCCHARLELEKARLIGLADRDAGLELARAVRARALEAEAVLLLNKSEALIRELKRGPGLPAGAGVAGGPAGARPRGPRARR